jgi:hypothetical protein
MALEQVTVEYNLALEKAKAQFNGLVQTIQQGEQKITNSSKQANNQILSDEQKAHNKRVQFIKEETQDLAELQKRKKLAYSPEEISQYNKRIAETQQRIKTLNGETGNLVKSNSNLITSFKNIAGAVGIAFGVQQLLSFGSELLALGQKSKTVTKAFNAIATSSDLGALRASTGFGVTDLQLKQLAVRANMFKISLNTLPSLLKFATIRAAETGQEVDYLVNSIIDGIGRQSPLILDNLGLSAIDVRTEFKKTGDMATAVANIIDRDLGNSVTSIDEATSAVQRFDTSLANIKERLATAFTSYTANGLKVISDGLTDFSNVSGGFETNLNEIESALGAYGESLDKRGQETDTYVNNVIDAYKRFGTVNGEVVDAVKRFREATDINNEAFKSLREEISTFTTEEQFTPLINKYLSQLVKLREANLSTTEAFAQLSVKFNLVKDGLKAIQTPAVEATNTLKSLGEELTGLKELFETTDVNSALFRTIQAEIKALEERIESIVNPTNKGSIAYFEAQLAKLEERLKKETSITKIKDLEHEIYLLGVRIAALKSLDTVLGDELISESVPADLDAANKAAIALIESLQLLNDTQLKELNKELERTSKELTALANQVTDDLWEEFKANIDSARQKQEEFNSILTSSVTTLVGDLTGLFNAIGQQQDDAINRQLEGEKTRAQEHFDIMKGIWQAQLENGQITKEEQFNQETAYNEKINALEAKQAEIRRQQLRKQAIAEKANASFQLIIGTATSVAKNLANPPAIIAILALAAAQLAIIAATPIPEFAKGVVGLQGAGTETSDSIHAKLSKGESVITAKATRANKDALTAMNNGEYEKFVQQKYIMPALEVKREKQRNSFAESISRSMQSGTYDDSLLIHETRKNKQVSIRNADQIGKATARELGRNSYFKNRV